MNKPNHRREFAAECERRAAAFDKEAECAESEGFYSPLTFSRAAEIFRLAPRLAERNEKMLAMLRENHSAMRLTFTLPRPWLAAIGQSSKLTFEEWDSAMNALVDAIEKTSALIREIEEEG